MVRGVTPQKPTEYVVGYQLHCWGFRRLDALIATESSLVGLSVIQSHLGPLDWHIVCWYSFSQAVKTSKNKARTLAASKRRSFPVALACVERPPPCNSPEEVLGLARQTFGSYRRLSCANPGRPHGIWSDK